MPEGSGSCQSDPNDAQAALRLLRDHHVQSTYGVSTPSPTNDALLRHSLEKDCANRTGLVRLVLGDAAARPTLVRYHLGLGLNRASVAGIRDIDALPDCGLWDGLITLSATNRQAGDIISDVSIVLMDSFNSFF